MKIQSIKVQNFGSFFGEHYFELENKGLAIVLGENQDEMRMNSNGSGKSTLFDALDWCLFGAIPRGDNVDSIINEEAKKDCKVVVTVQDDSGSVATITRYRKCDKINGVSITINAVDKTALDPGETQRAIEQFLGLDRDTFHASVLFGQTDLFRFADASDSERMESLTKILQLEEIDEWAIKAKEKAKEFQTISHKAADLLARTQGILSGLQAANFDQQIKDWEEGQQQKKAQLTQQLKDATAHVDKLKATTHDTAEIQKQVAELQANAPVDPPEVSEAQMKLTELNREQVEAEVQKTTVTNKAEGLRKTIVDITNKRGGTCGACGQAISEQHIEGEVSRLTAEHESLLREVEVQTQRWEEARKTRAVIEQALGALQAKEAARFKEHQAKVSELQAQLSVVEREQQALRTAEKAAEDIGAFLKSVNGEENPFEQKKHEQAQAIATAEAEEKVQQELFESAQDDLKYIEFWVDAFSSKGLKSYILDTKLQDITDAANHWVNLLTGGTIWVRIETQTMGRSTKTLRNKLNVRVFRYMPDGNVRERNYRSWSGGEKQRVSLGIDLGLSSLIAARSRKRYDLLIMDELFRHLDSSGREAVMDLLHHLKREKSSVFVVDHSEDFIAQFDRSVKVVKLSGRSRIEEETNDHSTGPRVQEKPKAATKHNYVPRRQSRPKRTPIEAG